MNSIVKIMKVLGMNSSMFPDKKDTDNADINILKVRDDYEPIRFKSSEGNSFKLIDEIKPEWIKNKDSGSFTKKELRHRIEPWLTSLFQSEHLSLLAGSGLTHAVHHIATGKKATGMERIILSKFSDQITEEAEKSAIKANRRKGNFEDQFRIANELLQGLEILITKSSSGEEEPFVSKEKIETLKTEIHAAISSFAASILESEFSIASANIESRKKAFTTLVNFIMSFASRTGTRDRLNIFTTNYDRYIEAGAEIAGVHLLDRFVGNLMPIFRSSRLNLDMHYNPPGIRGEPRYLEGVARFSKLHGSVDWIQDEDEIRRIALPFGATDIRSYLETPFFNNASIDRLMIYPNAAKDRETTLYPYAELFRDFAASTCRPNSTLVTYGYSFGDEHINRIIKDMLTIPSTHLVIISYDDPLERIMYSYNNFGRPSQISLMIGNHLGNLETIVNNYLPKSAIDKATFRMSEILKARFGSEGSEKQGNLDSETVNMDGKK